MYRASTLALTGMYLIGIVILIFASTFAVGFNIEYIPITGGLCGMELILYDVFKAIKKEEGTWSQIP